MARNISKWMQQLQNRRSDMYLDSLGRFTIGAMTLTKEA